MDDGKKLRLGIDTRKTGTPDRRDVYFGNQGNALAANAALNVATMPSHGFDLDRRGVEGSQGRDARCTQWPEGIEVDNGATGRGYKEGWSGWETVARRG